MTTELCFIYLKNVYSYLYYTKQSQAANKLRNNKSTRSQHSAITASSQKNIFTLKMMAPLPSWPLKEESVSTVFGETGNVKYSVTQGEDSSLG